MSRDDFKQLFQVNGSGYISGRIAECTSNTAGNRKNDEIDETYRKGGSQLQTPVAGVTAQLGKFLAHVKELSKHHKNLSVMEQHEWMVQKIQEEFPDLGEFTVNLMPPSVRPVRPIEPTQDKPEWLDMAKFRRGQKFARDNLVGVFWSQLCSLFMLFSSEPGMKTMVFTRKSDTPYLAFKRYLSTGLRVRNWYTEDPWVKGTAAYDDIKTVQKMHMRVNKKMRELSKDEFDEATRIQDVCCPFWPALSDDLRSTPQPPVGAYCPFGILETFHPELVPISQHHMFATQLGFAGLVVLFPREFGAHYATREDLEAFCHLWRAIGYLLGIEDEYNICRGSFEDVTQRFQTYLELFTKPNLRLVTPEWWHMMTCVFEGLQYYVPGLTTATAFLFLTDLLNIRTPRLKASISYAAWIRYYVLKFFLRYANMLSSVKHFLNARLNDALNRAISYTEEKHEELKRKSTATITQLSSCFSI